MKFQTTSIRMLCIMPAAVVYLMTANVQAQTATTPPYNTPDPTGSMDSRDSLENGGTTSDMKPGLLKPGTTDDATSSTPGDNRAFDGLDSDHDGFVSKLEGQQGGISDYSANDRNGDGRLDQDEFDTGNASTRSITPANPPSGMDSDNSRSSSTHRDAP